MVAPSVLKSVAAGCQPPTARQEFHVRGALTSARWILATSCSSPCGWVLDQITSPVIHGKWAEFITHRSSPYAESASEACTPSQREWCGGMAAKGRSLTSEVSASILTSGTSKSGLAGARLEVGGGAELEEAMFAGHGRATGQTGVVERRTGRTTGARPYKQCTSPRRVSAA